MSTSIFIEKGEPYAAGTLIKITNGDLFIGRQSQHHVTLPINFASLFISRQHCCLSYDGEITTLTDMGSKHGTFVNGNIVTPHCPYVLQHGDKIVLARGMVIMQFREDKGYEETIDFDDTQVGTIRKSIKTIAVDSEKRQCMVNGQLAVLTCKEWNCFTLLYENVNKLVTYNELRAAVWSERMSDDMEYCNVGNDEINVLLYRLRKKMGTSGHLIKNIRGCGFFLEG